MRDVRAAGSLRGIAVPSRIKMSPIRDAALDLPGIQASPRRETGTNARLLTNGKNENLIFFALGTE
jgi:hypothetical protein